MADTLSPDTDHASLRERASNRISEVYGSARQRSSAAIDGSRDTAARAWDAGAERVAAFAATGKTAGKRALEESRTHIDRAAFASRGLIAERPLTAVVIGVGAGIVLGLLANRLSRRAAAAEPADDEFE